MAESRTSFAEPHTLETYRRRNEELETQLLEARELLNAIHSGEVDAVIVGGPSGENQVYTLTDADRPYRILIEQMREGALTLSDDGIILYANGALAALLGRPLDAIIGTSFRTWVTPAPEQQSLLQSLLSGGKGELNLQPSHGQVVPVQLSVNDLRLEDTAGARVRCAIVTDLTDEKSEAAKLAQARTELATEAARSEGEGFARLILETATDYAIVAVDLQLRVTSWNAGAALLFGWSAEEMIGATVDRLWTAEDRSAGVPAAELETARRTGRCEDERWHQRRDGSRFWASGLLMPLDAGPDNRVGFLKILRDRTASRAAEAALRDSESKLQRLNETLEVRVMEELSIRQRTEDALRQSQKMEAVGQLTGGVAHDFNNLLTIIRSATEFLRRPDLAHERRQRYIEAIAETVTRAAKLTGQLLAFARRQALKPEIFDVAARVGDVTEMLGTIVGSRIQIHMTLTAPNQSLVEVDGSQFDTALVNMAVNARDAMDGAGSLSIVVENTNAIPPARGHAATPGEFVAVRITDTGCGIPADNLVHIFEPFYTTKAVGKGTGLGLSQVYGFGKQSGGGVHVQSEVGRGSTFTLYLPRIEHGVPVVAVDPVENGPVDGRGRRILVVEDNIAVGTFSTQLLQDLGYETAWAATGVEALKLIDEAAECFDAVFTDVVMPGMSGVELGTEVQRRRPGLPVVLTSGYSHTLAEEGLHGFEFVQKPYAIDELSRVLRRVFSQR